MDSFCYFTNQIPGGKSATGQHTRCYLFELFEKKHDNSTVRECLGVCVCSRQGKELGVCQYSSNSSMDEHVSNWKQ